MTKARGKQAKKKAPAKRRSKKPVDLQDVRQSITNLVGAEANTMADALVDEAKKGQLAPAKFLFEMAGIYPASAATAQPEDSDDLARVLLKELAFPKHTPETEEFFETNEVPALAGSDSVE